jgi:hypothetical protein
MSARGRRMRCRRLLAVALAATPMLLTACAEDVRLRNPATGETAVCKAVNYSHDGMANQIDKELQMRCVDDYQRQGYERVSE